MRLARGVFFILRPDVVLNLPIVNNSFFSCFINILLKIYFSVYTLFFFGFLGHLKNSNFSAFALMGSPVLGFLPVYLLYCLINIEQNPQISSLSCFEREFAMSLKTAFRTPLGLCHVPKSSQSRTLFANCRDLTLISFLLQKRAS